MLSLYIFNQNFCSEINLFCFWSTKKSLEGGYFGMQPYFDPSKGCSKFNMFSAISRPYKYLQKKNKRFFQVPCQRRFWYYWNRELNNFIWMVLNQNTRYQSKATWIVWKVGLVSRLASLAWSELGTAQHQAYLIK